MKTDHATLDQADLRIPVPGTDNDPIWDDVVLEPGEKVDTNVYNIIDRVSVSPFNPGSGPMRFMDEKFDEVMKVVVAKIPEIFLFPPTKPDQMRQFGGPVFERATVFSNREGSRDIQQVHLSVDARESSWPVDRDSGRPRLCKWHDLFSARIPNRMKRQLDPRHHGEELISVHLPCLR